MLVRPNKREHKLRQRLKGIKQLDIVNTIIVRIDVRGRIIFMNDQGLSFFGCTTKELLGESIADTILSDTDSRNKNCCNYIAAALGGTVADNQCCLSKSRKANGECVWVEWYYHEVKNELGEIKQIVSIGFDSTAQLVAREKFVANEVKMNKLFDNMPYACVFCQATVSEQGGVATYTVVAVNKLFKTLFAVKPENTDDSCFAKIFSTLEFFRPDWREDLGRVALNGISFTFEQYFAGYKKWFLVSVFSPQKYCFALTLEDITEKKMLTEEKDKIAGRYEMLLKHSFDAIILIDPHSKIIMDVNQSFCQMTGYTAEEFIGKTIHELFIEENNVINCCQQQLMSRQYLPPVVRKLRCKDGTLFSTERVAMLIIYRGRILELIVLHNVSEERKLQQRINDDVQLAGSIQRQMLPEQISNEFVDIMGIYQPLRVVSGDYFDYYLSKDKMMLTGYLVDVSGHGLATALEAAAISVLLKERAIRGLAPTKTNLAKLNKDMKKYFGESSFAALIIYQFDFRKRKLTYACCGINWVLAAQGRKQDWLKHRSSLIGIFEQPEFKIATVPICPGDSFYFLTDGLSERLADQSVCGLANYAATVKVLTDLAQQEISDDCSAVCVRVNGVVNRHQFYFNGLEEISALHARIRRILTKWSSDEALILEMVVNEAVNNVLLHGSGQGKLCLKLTKDKRVVLRVKDLKTGSVAGSILKEYESKPVEDLLVMMTSECGRGILLMKLYTDFIYYNRDGSEVLMVRKLK